MLKAVKAPSSLFKDRQWI